MKNDNGTVAGYLRKKAEAEWKEAVNKKVPDLEAGKSKTKRKQTSLPQQILLLHELNLLKLILPEIPSYKKAKFLSILLNGDEDNIRKTIQKINQTNSSAKTKENYQFLLETFNTLGLEEYTERINVELNSKKTATSKK